ncbi:MAG: acyltransferase [Prevotellaceae bacterium]|jgi:acetyltransferase-like isoleucine patch superfamily enzyme|nr:acyltransferase [Prevotellaceae bacterium]
MKKQITNNITAYQKRISGRSRIRFLIGLYPRLKKYLQLSCIQYIARKHGAIIGKHTVIPYSLAKKANANLIIGDNTVIQTDKIDLRSPVKIGNNVIIGRCEIITTSHYVDSPDFEHKYYGIEIEDYVWLTSYVLVTPACRHIGYGAVASVGSVVVKDVERMSIVGGNPAVHLRKREKVHEDLVVESLLGGDLKKYIKTFMNRNKMKT